MKTFTDQAGKTILIPGYPKRIVSLVPSQTELLADLGLYETVVGITKFCVHPESWFRTKTRVGGTKKLKLDIIGSLNPDLIIANKEENERGQVEELAKRFPVWTSDISSLIDAIKMIHAIGEITGRLNEADILVRKINGSFHDLKDFFEKRKPLSAAYLIWNDPVMTAGGDTFISSMMNCAGFKNIFDDLKRYPEITMAMIKDRNPEVVILSSEPYPFKEKHLNEFRTRLIGSKVFLADGEMFSWHGSRLQYAPSYFRKLFEQIQSYS